MALGEKAVFEIERFLLPYDDDRAMCVECQEPAEVVEFFRLLLEEYEVDTIGIRLPEIGPILSKFQHNESVNFYIGKNASPRVQYVTFDDNAEYGRSNDYYFRDIEFHTDVIEVKNEDLLAFLQS